MSIEETLNRLAAAIEAQTAVLVGMQTRVSGPAAEQIKTDVKKPAATKAKKEETAAPETSKPAAPVMELKVVAEVLDQLVAKNRDLAVSTLKSFGVPEKDGVPRVGQMPEEQRPALLEVLKEALKSLEQPEGNSFV